jgi:hypothetical protein
MSKGTVATLAAAPDAGISGVRESHRAEKAATAVASVGDVDAALF